MQVCTLFLSINIKRHIQETHCESVIPEKLKKQKTLMDERKNGLTATHSIRPTAKGQLIWTAIYSVLDSPKKRTKKI